MSFILSNSTTGNRLTYYLLAMGLKEEWTEIWSLAIFDIPENGVMNLAFNELKLLSTSFSDCINNISNRLDFDQFRS